MRVKSEKEGESLKDSEKGSSRKGKRKEMKRE